MMGHGLALGLARTKGPEDKPVPQPHEPSFQLEPEAAGVPREEQYQEQAFTSGHCQPPGVGRNRPSLPSPQRRKGGQAGACGARPMTVQPL